MGAGRRRRDSSWRSIRRAFGQRIQRRWLRPSACLLQVQSGRRLPGGGGRMFDGRGSGEEGLGKRYVQVGGVCEALPSVLSQTLR